MSRKLKALREERVTKLEEIETLNAKEDLGEEDLKQFDALKNEIEQIDRDINRETFVQEARKQAAKNADIDDSSKREINKYSFIDAARQAKTDGNFTGFIAEMHQEGEREAREAGITLTGNGLIIPQKVLHNFKNDMTAGTAADGGNAIATELRGFIEKLTERLVLRQVGADFLPGLTGNIDWPTEDVLPTFSWKGENATHDKSSPKVGKKSVSPKRGGTYVDLSNQLLIQTAPSIEQRIINQLVGAVQRGLDSAGINGSGTGNEPEGILNTTGIGDVAGGTDGGAPDWEHIVALETAVAVENADIGSLNYLTNSKVRGTLKNTRKDAGSGLFVWRDDRESPLNGYGTAVTNLVPSDLTKGEGEDLSAIIFGNFNDLIMAQWGGIELLRDPFARALEGITRLIVNVYADVLVTRPESFAAMKDAITD